MSFFLQAKRNTGFQGKQAPSPFDYNISSSRKQTRGYAPFSSTTKLDRAPIRRQNLQPGGYQQQSQLAIQDAAALLNPQQKMLSMFKSKSERKMHLINNVPGPGSYELRSKFKPASRGRSEHSYQSIQVKKPTNPSIPLDNLGFQYNQNNVIQKVRINHQSGPAPGAYDINRTMLSQRGLTWRNSALNKKPESNEDEIPGPGAYNPLQNKQAKAPTSCFNSTLNRFDPKKIKPAYQPGPGEYNNGHPARITRAHSQGHFNSKVSRFPSEKPANPGPGSYLQTRNRSVTSFNKKVLQKYAPKADQVRKTIFAVADIGPGPGEYIAREGMTFQLQKALLRKHNESQFPNTRREVFEVKDELAPGPGAYDPSQPKGSNKGNLGYKKVQVVNLKQGQDAPQPSPVDYEVNNFTLSRKIESVNNRLTLTEKKPFNSGADRFAHYKQEPGKKLSQRNQTHDTDDQSMNSEQNMYSQFEGPKKIKKLIMTSVKVKVPFGSSASKFEMGEPCEVGPGSYNSGKDWVKPTYSIKAKLNKRN